MRRCGIAIGLVLGLGIGCGSLAESPEDVAESFWAAVKAGDAERAREYASHASLEDIEGFFEFGELGQVLVAEALENEEAAIVKTSLRLRSGENDDESRVDFYTELVRAQEGWRVDVPGTRSEVRKAIFAAGLRDIGDAVGAGMREAGEAVGRAMEELHRALRDAFEDPDEKGERL